MTEPTKDLIVGIDLTAIELYTVENINALLKEIEKKALAVNLPDASTDKNRKEIITHSFRATTSKTMIVKGAEKITENWRKDTKTVNGVKKIADEFLTDLAKKIRQPVTDWEVAEKERTRVTAVCLEYLTMSRMVAAGTSSETIMDKINEVDLYEYPDVTDSDILESLQAEQETTLTILKGLHTAAVQTEQEKIELDQLRKEKEEREQKEKSEAEEKKRLEEEAKAKEQRIAKEKQDEVDRLANEERIRKEEKEKAEAEKKEAAEKAEADKKEAVAIAEREAEEKAAMVEKERLAKIEEQRRACEARAADRKHRSEIDDNVCEALVKMCGLTAADATKVVATISTGNIPNTSIKY